MDPTGSPTAPQPRRSPSRRELAGSPRRSSSPTGCPRPTPPCWPTRWSPPSCGATPRTACCGCPGTSRGCAPARWRPGDRRPRWSATPAPSSCSTATTASARWSPQRAVDLGIERARAHGISGVAVRDSGHFGTAAYFTRQAAEAGCVAFLVDQRQPGDGPVGRAGQERSAPTPGRSRHPPGATGSSSWTWPTPRSPAARSTSRPSGASRSPRAGPPTPTAPPPPTPPRPSQGLILPMAGPKGYVIAFMMDVLAGVLTGSAFGDGVAGPYDPDRRSGAGHLLVTHRRRRRSATRPSSPPASRRSSTRPAAVPLAAWADEILVPGELEDRTRARLAADGIPLAASHVGEPRRPSRGRPAPRLPPTLPSRSPPRHPATGGSPHDRPRRVPAGHPRPARGVHSPPSRENAERSVTDEPGCLYFDVVAERSPTTTTSSSTSSTSTRTPSPPTARHRTSRGGAQAADRCVVPGSQVNTLAAQRFHHGGGAVVRILVLPGDGIGPEITAATVEVLGALDERSGSGLELEQRDIGLASLAAVGTDPARRGPRARAGGRRHHPRPGLALRLPAARRGRDQPVGRAAHAVRAVTPTCARAGRSTGSRVLREPMDLVIVRENTEGFYSDRNMYAGSGEFMPDEDSAFSIRKVTARASREGRAGGLRPGPDPARRR